MMVDQIVELENNRKYVMLETTNLGDKTYYFGLRLDDDEEPTNNYLFFEEINENNDVYLLPVEEQELKGLLLTAFTTSYLNMVYDM